MGVPLAPARSFDSSALAARSIAKSRTRGLSAEPFLGSFCRGKRPFRFHQGVDENDDDDDDVGGLPLGAPANPPDPEAVLCGEGTCGEISLDKMRWLVAMGQCRLSLLAGSTPMFGRGTGSRAGTLTN